MKEENYLEGIYGCLERIEKKVETLPVEGTSPAVGNRTSSPEGIAELKIRLERLQSAVEKNGLEIAAVRNHTVRLSEGWPLSAETFAGEMEKIRYCLSQDCQAVKETVRRLDERMVLLKKEPERRLVTYRLESASKAVVTTASALILALIISVWTNCNQYRTNRLLKDAEGAGALDGRAFNPVATGRVHMPGQIIFGRMPVFDAMIGLVGFDGRLEVVQHLELDVLRHGLGIGSCHQVLVRRGQFGGLRNLVIKNRHNLAIAGCGPRDMLRRIRGGAADRVLAGLVEHGRALQGRGVRDS